MLRDGGHPTAFLSYFYNFYFYIFFLLLLFLSSISEKGCPANNAATVLNKGHLLNPDPSLPDIEKMSVHSRLCYKARCGHFLKNK